MNELNLKSNQDINSNEKTYNDACLLMKSSDLNLLQSAVEFFDSIPGYKDSAEKSAQCKEKLKKLIIRAEKDRKYMKLNIAIICSAMLMILALLTVFIITFIYRDNMVREFTQRDPIKATRNIEETISTDVITE